MQKKVQKNTAYGTKNAIGSEKSLILQQIADLGQQDFLSGGSGRCGRLSGSGFLFLLLAQLSHLIQGSDQEEHNQCQDQEVDDGRNEVADEIFHP